MERTYQLEHYHLFPFADFSFTPEWNGIPDVLKTVIKGLIDTLQVHSDTIKYLNSKTSEKPSRDELIKSLEIKANTADVLRSLDEIHSKIEKKNEAEIFNENSNEYAKKFEIEAVKNKQLELKNDIAKQINSIKQDILKIISDNSQKSKNDLTEVDKHVNKIDNEFDNLISHVAKQFENFNKGLTSIDNCKLDVSTLVKIRDDLESDIDNKINQCKQEFCQIISGYKTDVLMMKNNPIEQTHEETGLNEKFVNLQLQLEEEVDKIRKAVNSMNATGNINASNPDTNNAVSTNQLESVINEIRFVKAELQRKADISEMTSLLKEKVDNSALEAELSTKVSQSTFEKVLGNNVDQLKNSINQLASTTVNALKHDKDISEIHFLLTQQSESIAMKANMKELIGELSKYLQKENLAEALNQVYYEIDQKVSNDAYLKYTAVQSQINNIFCQENVMAKFIWTNSDFSQGFIKWNRQVLNSSPDNYFWEKDGIYITIREKGIYRVVVTLFIKEDSMGTVGNGISGPTVQLFIDGKRLLSEFSGNLVKNNSIENEKGIIGLDYSEVVDLDTKSRIAIAVTPCSGISKAKGVLVIKAI